MKNTLVLIGLSLLLTTSFAYAKDCKKGKPCGDSCIAKTATCTKDAPTASPAPSASPAQSIDDKAEKKPKVKNCKKGKLCGDSCIPKDSECKK